MPGFRHCSWCNGKGCIACDAEQKKWEKAEADRREAHKNRTVDEVRKSLRDLLWIRDGGSTEGVSLGCQIAVQLSGRDSLDMNKINQEIASEQAILDAEYARQFPDGPKPIFTANMGNPNDVAALKHAFHREVLEQAFGPEGRGMDEIMERVEQAKAMQANVSPPPGI